MFLCFPLVDAYVMEAWRAELMAWTLTGVLWSRSPRAEGLRGGEAWRAGRDAGRSHAAAGHERLPGRSAAERVRAAAAAAVRREVLSRASASG